MPIQKIAVFGAGATGTIIGALMAKAGHDVLLVSTNKAHVKALNEKGAHITGGIDDIIKVKAAVPDEISDQFDLVIYSVKSTQDDVALPQVKTCLRDDSLVLTTQNGVPEEKLASVVGKHRTLGGSIVGWAASLPSAGTARLAGSPDSMMFRIGELDGQITGRLQEVAKVLSAAGKVELSEDLTGMRWTKLIINVSMSGLSAALGCTFGEILDDDKAISTSLCLKLETLKVAQKLGVFISEANGQPTKEFIESMRRDPELAKAQLRSFFEPQRAGKPSMLQDLEAGKQSEVESINGYLAKKADAAAVSTPVNNTVLQIIRDIEGGRATLSMQNLNRIELPDLQQSAMELS